MNTRERLEQQCAISADSASASPPLSVEMLLKRAADKVMSELSNIGNLTAMSPSRLVRQILKAYVDDLKARGQQCSPCELVFAARELLDPTMDQLEVSDSRHEKYQLTSESMLQGAAEVRTCEVAGASDFSQCYLDIATLLAYIATKLPR